MHFIEEHVYYVDLTNGKLIPLDYFFSPTFIISLTAAGLFILVGGAIVIFRPFRRNVHNFSNFVLTFLLLNINEIMLALGRTFVLDCTLMSLLDFITYMSSASMLVLIVIGYCAYMIIKKSKIACTCGFIPKTESASANNDEQRLMQELNINVDPSLNNDFDADRIVNPDNYEERHFSNTWLESHILDKQSSNTTQSDDIPLDQCSINIY